jgi:hypothetical protein
MARKPAPQPVVVDMQDEPDNDAILLWSQWLEHQRQLAGAGFEQMAQSQQMLMLSWLRWMQACWAPWTPFLQRGGEQLA